MRISKTANAENIRYAKIKRLTDLLCSEEKGLIDAIAENQATAPFKVGKRITVDGDSITIKGKAYSANQLNKVTVSKEGSMGIYDRYGKKLCGWIALNSACHNIELFCLWIRKYNVPAEVLSGKAERIFRIAFLILTVLAIILSKILKYVNL